MVGHVWLCLLLFTKQVTRKIIRWEFDTALGRKNRKEAVDLSCLGQQGHVMWICYGWTVELCNSVWKRKRKQQCETQEIFHTDHRLGIRRERKKTMETGRNHRQRITDNFDWGGTWLLTTTLFYFYHLFN